MSKHFVYFIIFFLIFVVGKWIMFSYNKSKIINQLEQVSTIPTSQEPAEINEMNTQIEQLSTEEICKELESQFVKIPSGNFIMGSPLNEPGRRSGIAEFMLQNRQQPPNESEKINDREKQHRVTITKAFYMQITEVTQRQWQVIMGENPSKFKKCGPSCPVENVSWYDVQKFIKKLNQITGKNYRLPSEAEWEYACRCGTLTPYYLGECLNTDQANYDGRFPLNGCLRGIYRQRTTPVRTFSPNPWGLYDMCGNVMEWCQDLIDYYPPESCADPSGPSTGSHRVLRGGSYNLTAAECRSASRMGVRPDRKMSGHGFRLVFLPMEKNSKEKSPAR